MIIFGMIVASVFLIIVIGMIHISLRRARLLQNRDRWLIGSLVICVPICAGLLYAYLGDASGWWRYTQEQRNSQQIASQVAVMKQHPEMVVKQFEAFLKTHPDDAKGWMLLAKIAMDQGQYAKAVDAFNRAETVDQTKSFALDLQIGRAEARSILQEGRLNAQDRLILLRYVKQASPPDLALHLLAQDAYQRKDYAVAISYWERILPDVARGSEEEQAVLNWIAKAQKAEI